MRRALQRGDTLIEVVLAFAIFAMAAVSTIALINSGLATTQRNLETTLVRQQIDAQAEILRHLRDTPDAAWSSIIAPANLVNQPSALANSCKTLESSDKAFYVQPTVDADNPENTSFARTEASSPHYVKPVTYAKINYSDGATRSEGIWIQATKAEGNAANTITAYDIYIHACWDSVGVNTPMTLGTIVRIYE